MKKGIYIVTVLSLVSCGTYDIDSGSHPVSSRTLKRSFLASGLCAIVGGFLGKKYSPNVKSQGANTLIFGGASAVTCGAMAGYVYHKEEIEMKYDESLYNEDGSLGQPLNNIGELR